jgi:3'(2'), 5'-bisphosphate nucleotidase
MTTIDRAFARDRGLEAAREAAALIMRVYAEGFEVEFKSKDDPVTRADKEANALLCDALERAFPGVPIVAEESDPSTFQKYRTAREAFFVDPLDGTREFVARNGQFCVMIGLAEEGRATAGVILCPAIGITLVGGIGLGAHAVAEDGTRSPIAVTKTARREDAEIVVSRTHAPKDVDAFASKLGVRKVSPVGSSGVKGAYIASGRADAYVQMGPAGCLWDTCAVDGIVHGAGGKMTDGRGDSFDYRREQLRVTSGVLATNGVLHDELVAMVLRNSVLPQG